MNQTSSTEGDDSPQTVVVPLLKADQAGTSQALEIAPANQSAGRPLAPVDFDIAKSLGMVEGRLQVLQDKYQDIDNTVDNINIAIGVLLAFVSIVGFGIFIWIRNQLSRMVRDASKVAGEEHLLLLHAELEQTRARIEKSTGERAAAALVEIKEAYFRYARILSLVEIKKYDAALRAGGVVEVPEDKHKELPEEVQAALIKALCRSSTRNVSDSAWIWAAELAKRRSRASLRCLLETGSKLAREEEAITLYDEFSGSLDDRDRAELEPMLLVLLRRGPAAKRTEYANRLTLIAERHQNSDDVSVVVNIAAIYRDRGMFDFADSMLRTALNKIRDALDGHWEDSFARLLSTLIANCVDRNEVGRGVEYARLLLARSSRPDQIFSCMRLAWRLPTSDPDRLFFANAVLSRHKDGYLPENDDGTWKSMALAHDIMGDQEKCEALLKSHMVRLADAPTSLSRKFLYFLRCCLAEILIARPDRNSWQSALDLLTLARQGDTKGEASFLAACAYQKLGDRLGVTEALNHARSTAGDRWVNRAKYDPILSSLPEVAEAHAVSAPKLS